MKDPAVGRSRAERAFGPGGGKQEPATKKKKKTAPLKTKRSTVNDIRNTNNGMFAGPKPTYGRYNVSEQAADLLNRSKNKGTR
jgi:hypothetical protein